MPDAVTVHHGDSRDVLRTYPDAHFDSVVCDPPYALVSIVKRFGSPNAKPGQGRRADDPYVRASAGFMGQQWDTGETAFAAEFWAEVFRVLKPGGHVLAFSATRTYHRLACAIEDAGFEVRDMVAWAYGCGFPKSHDVAKGIDKRRDEDEPAVRAVCRFVRAAMDRRGLKSADLTGHFGGCHSRLIDHWAARETDSQPSLPTPEQWATLKAVLGLGDEMDAEVDRLNARKGEPGGFGEKRFGARDNLIRELSPEARAWSGWGTALKPALEPVVMARKPLVGTVAQNALAHGTGALNIDACRVAADESTRRSNRAEMGYGGGNLPMAYETGSDLGRWPANLIHDGSEEVGASLADAARFFYSAKASKADRAGSKHPTVKPVALMAYLCRLVTPPGGLVLDPFAGSGTTGEAAAREGFRAVLIEREAEYVADIRRRLARMKGEDEPLFGANDAAPLDLSA